MEFIFTAGEATHMMRFKNMMKRELSTAVDMPTMSTDREYAMQMLLKGKSEGSPELSMVADHLIDSIGSKR